MLLKHHSLTCSNEVEHRNENGGWQMLFTNGVVHVKNQFVKFPLG